MKSIRFLVLVISMLPLSAYADPWLCVGEYVAVVTDKDGEVIGAEGSAAVGPEKFIIDETGLKALGEDYVLFQSCRFDDAGRPMFCEGEDERQWGKFRMAGNNLFTLVTVSFGEDSTTYDVTIKGKCSKIDY